MQFQDKLRKLSKSRASAGVGGGFKFPPLNGQVTFDSSVGSYGFPFGGEDRLNVEAEGFRYAVAICQIGFVEMFDLQLLNAFGCLTEASRDVSDQSLLRIGRHQPEKISGLRVVVAVIAMIVPSHCATHQFRTLEIFGILRRATKAIRLVIHFPSVVSVETHRAVLVIGMVRALRLVYREGVVVHTEAVAVRVRIGNEARLQHLIR